MLRPNERTRLMIENLNFTLVLILKIYCLLGAATIQAGSRQPRGVVLEQYNIEYFRETYI